MKKEVSMAGAQERPNTSFGKKQAVSSDTTSPYSFGKKGSVGQGSATRPDGYQPFANGRGGA